MSASFELTIKNDRLAAIVGRLLQEQDMSKPDFDGKTEQQIGEDMIATYAYDLLISGVNAGVKLDFSYQTLANLTSAVYPCFQGYAAQAPFEASVEGLTKSIAAYLFALAMNEHGCEWEVRRMPVLLNPSKPSPSPLWGVFRIQTGIQKKDDFLLSVNQGCKVIDGKGKRLLTFVNSVAIASYKSAVGVDLPKLKGA